MVEPNQIDKQRSRSITPQSAGNFLIENASRLASASKSHSSRSSKHQDEEDNVEEVNSEIVEDEEEEEEEEEEDAEYDVEAIRSRRKNPRTGLYEYLVKWENYPESQNTWEPIDNLKCPDLIARFNEKENNKRKRRSTNDSSSSQKAPQSQTKRPKRSTSSPDLNNEEEVKHKTKRRIIDEEQEEEPFLLEEDNNSDKVETLSSSSDVTDGKEKAKTSKDSVEPVHQQVKGFDRGLPIEKIVGSCIDDNNKLWFFIKWKDLDVLDLVDSNELEEKAPRDLCCWYRDRLYYAFNNPTSDVESKSVGEMAAATDVS